MKKSAIIFALILFYIIKPVQSQSYNLEKFIGKGQLIEGRALLNDDKSLYGYFFLFRQIDNIFSTHPHYEYFVLDKNLNEVLTNSFDLVFDAKFCVYGMPRAEKSGNNVLLNDMTFVNNMTQTPIVRSLGLKDNSISDYYLFFDNEFIKFDQENKVLRNKMRHPKMYSSIIPVSNVFFNGMMVLDRPYFPSDENIMNSRNLRIYSADTVDLWNMQYDKDDTKTTFRFLNDYLIEDTTLLICYEDIERNTVKKVVKRQKLVSYNIKTGEVNFIYTVKSDDDANVYDFELKKYNNAIYLNGTYQNATKFSTSATSQYFGWVHIALNEKGKELNRNLVSYLQADSVRIKNKLPHINFSDLTSIEEYQFKNGSGAYLLEKTSNTARGKYILGDFWLIIFDENFRINQVHHIDKHDYLSFESSYLFGQYLNDNNDLVFFIKDKKKSPETNKMTWSLGINKIINGKYEYEEIPLGSKNEDFQIFPYIAKEGYILLREFNEKEKYDQLRLEKLNL
jgi:hypothetical protein